MDKQLLLVILSSAATAMAVAVGLGSLLRRTRFANGWLIEAAAIAAAVIPAARLALGGWPPFPAVQAVDWIPTLAVTALLGLVITAWMPARLVLVRAAVAAGAVAAVVIAFPLARAIGRMEGFGERAAWMAGVAIVMMSGAAAVAAAFSRAARADDPSAGVVARFRDRHWATFALGMILGIGAPAMLFATHFKKLLDIGVGMACGMGGLAVIAWLVLRRLDLAGAGVVAVLVYFCLWLTGYFYGGADPEPVALALGMAAPFALVIGAWGPLARRGGWVRLVVVGVVGVGLVAAAAGLHGPAYLQELREMQQYGE